jgi:hypothetical protein
MFGEAVEYEPDDVPFPPAESFYANVPRDDVPMVVVRIDDTFCAFLERDLKR